MPYFYAFPDSYWYKLSEWPQLNLRLGINRSAVGNWVAFDDTTGRGATEYWSSNTSALQFEISDVYILTPKKTRNYSTFIMAELLWSAWSVQCAAFPWLE